MKFFLIILIFFSTALYGETNYSIQFIKDYIRQPTQITNNKNLLMTNEIIGFINDFSDLLGQGKAGANDQLEKRIFQIELFVKSIKSNIKSDYYNLGGSIVLGFTISDYVKCLIINSNDTNIDLINKAENLQVIWNQHLLELSRNYKDCFNSTVRSFRTRAKP